MSPALARTVTLAAAISAASASAACTRDTRPPEVAIRELWDEYLRSKEGDFSANASAPTELWLASEQSKWPLYDLAGYFLLPGARADSVAVRPATPAEDDVYEIVTRFRDRVSWGRDTTTRPGPTITVLARRVRGQWRLASVLPLRTKAWRRERRGRIEFHVAPALTFDPTRAASAAAFVDSLANALEVPAPKRIEYYVAESVDQANQILGFETLERYGPKGGFARPVNGQVFSGNPALGENYRHELAHVVLLPVLRDSPTSLLASEGVPTWLGGTGGKDFRTAVQELDSALRADPTLTLDRIVADMTVVAVIRNPAGAVLAQMMHDAGGAEAVRGYLRSGGNPAVLRANYERLLGRPWERIAADWRAAVERIARGA